MPPKKTNMPLKKKAKFSKDCRVCSTSVTHLRRHSNRSHIPWYMCPAFACAGCQTAGDLSDIKHFHQGHSKVEGETSLRAWYLLVNGFFLFISRCLGLNTAEALLSLVVTEQVLPADCPFLEEELFFLKEYDRLVGLEPKDFYSACPPTRISEMLHYKILMRLILKLEPVQKDLALSRRSYVNPDGSRPPTGHPVFKYHVIDGHFHLDELIGRSGKSFKELEALSGSTVNLVHAIANFVYPNKWKLLPKLMGMDSRISFTLGIHPHLLYSNTVDYLFSRLTQEFAKHPIL